MASIKGFEEMKADFTLSHAIVEANRCLLCYDAPCSKGCPGETDPGTFIRKLRFRNITGAIRTIKENNILGGACGALCPSSRLCEKECTATGIGAPIQISNIQRALIEHSWDIKFNPLEKGDPKDGKIAIIGAGPAGLSCAAELAKRGYRCTIFEAKSEPGGILRYGVPSFRFSKEFLEKEISDVKKLGVDIKCGSLIKTKEEAAQLLQNGFNAIFLAPGLWKPLTLLTEGSQIKGLYSSIDFLVSVREDKSPNLKGKKVAVIGGGSTAIDCCESALHLGAEDVFLIYRRSFTQMPAESDERLRALEKGIHFFVLNQPVEYIKDGNNTLKGIKLRRTKLGDKDASGRRKPVEISGSEWILEIDLVIEAIGLGPTLFTGENLIKVDKNTGKTSDDGLFAGGDIIRGPGLVVEAVQDGKIAAKAIDKYLSK